MKIWKRWRRALSMVCLVALVGGQAHAVEQAATAEKAASAEKAVTTDNVVIAEPNGFGRAWTSFKADTDKFPDRFISDAKTTFWNGPNLVALGLAGVATGVFENNYDDKINDHFERHGKMSKSLEDGLYVAGNPGTHFAITGLWYGLAAGSGNSENQEKAMTMMSALAITGASTMSLKWMANNDCPNGAEYGWPSGHTSSTMAAASVLDEFYGPAVGIPAYAFTGLMGYRMMEEGDHWASDVIFGAVLGYVVGHSVAGKAKKAQIAGCDIVPFAGPDGSAMGMGLMKKF
jgi:membrane-associated phospholipid phosphatase